MKNWKAAHPCLNVSEAFTNRSIWRIIVMAIIVICIQVMAIDLNAQNATEKKTNIVFIVCDDLNDFIGRMGGHPQAKTPYIDRLADEGVLFTNAASNGPLCSPSRMSFLTGLYPHTTGYYIGRNNLFWDKHPVIGKSQTFMEYFTQSGYYVYGTGKIFHNGQEKEGVWKWLDRTEHYGLYSNWGPWPWDGSKPKKDYEWGNTQTHPKFPIDYGIGLSYGSLDEVPNVPPNSKTGAPGYNGWRLNNEPFRYVNENDRDLMPDEINAKWVQDNIDKGLKEPFIISVGMNRPHTPTYSPKSFFDMYPLESLQLTNMKEGDLDDIAEILGRNKKPEILGKNTDFGFTAYNQIMNLGGKEELLKQIQAYLAAVSYVDEQIGKVINSIKNSPHAENTLIVLTSDNGFQLGKKERFFKHALWEDATRIPFIVAGPGVAKGMQCTTPISLIDLYPTFIDYAGLPKEPHKSLGGPELDGHSLRPLLENPEKGKWDGPDVNLTAVGRTAEVLGNSTYMAPTEDQHFAVRSERYRYILAGNGEEELYDHKNDPEEYTNVAHNPEYAKVKKEMRTKLLKITGRK